MTDLLIQPQRRPLMGSVRVPGDKSISHRALILAGVADGASRVRGWLPAGDTLATLQAMRDLGVEVAVTERAAVGWDLTVTGRGLGGLQAAAGPLDCGNAGTCLRLLAGLLAGQPFPSTLDGSAQLRRRPMARVVEPLRQMGARIADQDGRAPLRIEPAALHGTTYALPVASAQVKSAVLLAGLYSAGATTVHEPRPARDHTERLLQAMGVAVETDGPRVTVRGPAARLAPLELDVPGDLSSAAFVLVAATIIPGSAVTIQHVGTNATRTGLLDILVEMGAGVTASRASMSGGEPAADLTARAAALRPVTVRGDRVVRAIDELPIWAVAATQAAGESVLAEAGELRVKEVDRIAAMVEGLRKMGASIAERPDGLIVSGPARLRGAAVESHGDHRLAMALAVAGLAADGPTVVRDAGCIADSFPGFAETLEALGATVRWQ